MNDGAEDQVSRPRLRQPRGRRAELVLPPTDPFPTISTIERNNSNSDLNRRSDYQLVNRDGATGAINLIAAAYRAAGRPKLSCRRRRLNRPGGSTGAGGSTGRAGGRAVSATQLQLSPVDHATDRAPRFPAASFISICLAGASLASCSIISPFFRWKADGLMNLQRT